MEEYSVVQYPLPFDVEFEWKYGEKGTVDWVCHIHLGMETYGIGRAKTQFGSLKGAIKDHEMRKSTYTSKEVIGRRHRRLMEISE